MEHCNREQNRPLAPRSCWPRRCGRPVKPVLCLQPPGVKQVGVPCDCYLQQARKEATSPCRKHQLLLSRVCLENVPGVGTSVELRRCECSWRKRRLPSRLRNMRLFVDTSWRTVGTFATCLQAHVSRNSGQVPSPRQRPSWGGRALRRWMVVRTCRER